MDRNDKTFFLVMVVISATALAVIFFLYGG